MEQLICHLTGDYLLQNSWMAFNKPKYTIPCLIHCLIYTAVFAFITQNPLSLFIIFATHFVIDRFSLGRKYAQFMSGARTDYIHFWLGVIYDNSIHLLINFLVLYWIG